MKIKVNGHFSLWFLLLAGVWLFFTQIPTV